MIEKHYGVADGSIIMEECMKRVRQKLKVYVPKKPGAERIVKAFHDKGMRLAVASSSYPEQIESNLKLAGMREYFDAVVSGKEVEHGKPAPDIFLLAAERIAVHRKPAMSLKTAKTASTPEKQQDVPRS